MSGGVPAGEAHDPGTPAYEAARLTIAAELRRIAVDEPKSGYREMADRLMKGGQYQIPSWVAMRLLARATPTPPIEGRDADVERVARAIAKIAHNGRIAEEAYWADPCTGCNEYRVMARAALQALGERG